MEAVKSRGWRQWLGCVVAVAALQFFLVYKFSAPGPGPVQDAPPATQVALCATPVVTGPLASAVMDPTLFALPNRFGFSREAWLRPTGFAHPIETPRPAPWFLRAPLEVLGDAFHAYAETVRPFPLEASLPLATPSMLVQATMVMPAQASVFEVTGPVSGRGLISVPSLPSIAHRDLLSNSVVRIIVDGQGYVRSQALLSSSGRREADDAALEGARKLQFAPLAGPVAPGTLAPAPEPESAFRLRGLADLEVGTFVVYWRTLPLTNAPAGAR